MAYLFEGQGAGSVQASPLEIFTSGQRDFLEILKILDFEPGQFLCIERAFQGSVQGLADRRPCIRGPCHWIGPDW